MLSSDTGSCGTMGKPWTEEDVAKLRNLARRIPTRQIAKELGRGVPATVMMAHALRISLRLKPKKGSGEADLRVQPETLPRGGTPDDAGR